MSHNKMEKTKMTDTGTSSTYPNTLQKILHHNEEEVPIQTKKKSNSVGVSSKKNNNQRENLPVSGKMSKTNSENVRVSTPVNNPTPDYHQNHKSKRMPTINNRKYGKQSGMNKNNCNKLTMQAKEKRKHPYRDSVKTPPNSQDVLQDFKLVINDENVHELEKVISKLLSPSNTVVEYGILIKFIDLVSKVSVGESSFKDELLYFVFRKHFLDAVSSFLLKNLKNSKESERGLPKCEMVLKKFLDLSTTAIKLLPHTALDFLKHTLLFIRILLCRISFNHKTFERFVFKIEQILKMDEFEEEKLSLQKFEMTKFSQRDVYKMKNMSVLPTVDDLCGKKPELRKNIIDGKYENSDHYLTVQFTLLREDFIAPLREGLVPFLSSTLNKENANTQVMMHHHVRILRATTGSGKFGHIVQINRKVNWGAASQFFIFGSLLLFTTDKFQSFFTGVVIEAKKASKNKDHLVMVELNVDYSKVCKDIYAQEFLMAVPKVFFLPYYHVLTALQSMSTEEFPMKKYIVDVCPEPQPPAYLEGQICPGNHTSSAEKLNSSQKKAFDAALTKEFVAIQGPPGTGKTFLGLQIVSELLDSAGTNTPILVVCYKNHALDQFLEGILNKTNNVIRIGGRSTNKKLKGYNLKDRRGRYGYQFHESLRVLACDYFSTENQMVVLRKKGIVSIQNVVQYIESPRFRDELMSIHMDDWLMEGVYINENSNNVNAQDCRVVRIESKAGSKKESKKDFAVHNIENIVSNRSSHKVHDCNTHTYESTEQDDIRSNSCVKHLKENNNTKDNLLFNSDNICVGSLSFDCPLNTDFLESEEGENQTENVKFVCDIETYIDDYSSVYNDVPKEVEQRKWNSPKNSTKTGMDQNCFETLNPQFTITISYLEEVIGNDRITIKKLLEDENITDKVREHWLSVLVTEIKDIENRLNFLKRMLSYQMCFKPKKTKELYALGERFGIGALDNVQRWYLYHSWINCLADDMRSYMIELEKTIRFEEQKLDEARGKADLAALRKAEVVGVTTSGAAKNRSTLNELGANIGDHKQLRPNPAVYELCTKYNLDVSLFERMVRNGLSCHTLDLQHRMRPEFAALITPSIYVHLGSHSTTENRPDIRGIHKNLYFINHNKPEEKDRETESHVNKFEAGFVLELAKYLLKQGYSADEITILATYSGQVKRIIKIRDHIMRDVKDHSMRDLKITTVDDFQGEENKIIILSLVRSNEDGNIGFLKTENRVCVALSRARDGLYIFGNMDCLTKKSQIWPQVKEKLLEYNALGATLSVYCQKHQKTTQVKNGPMFKDMPEGGCSLKCEEKLSCGHVCEYYCHPQDQQHEKEYMCPKLCKRKLCRMNHPCHKKCGEKCGPCMQEVKFNLACGHNMLAACSSDPKELVCRAVYMPYTLPCGHDSSRACGETEEKLNNKKCIMACNKKLRCGHGCTILCGHMERCDSFECRAEVDITLECGHKVKVKCSKRRKPRDSTIKVETSQDQVELFPQDFDEPIKCTEKADTKLGCGHIKLLSCGLSKKELQKILCSEPVSKILPCGHQLTVECSNSRGKLTCRKPYKKTMRSGHICDKMCSDFYSCKKIVEKELPCGHIVRVPCGANDVTCNHPCLRDLACGHVCQDKCGEKCGTTPCPKIVEMELPCGHKVRAPCGANNVTCNHPCTRNLACGHVCQDKCGKKCGTTPCQKLTTSTLSPSCGHGPVTVPCFNTIGGAKLSADKLADFCTAECATILPCNHLCTGKCGNCRRQRTHSKCNQQCAKTLPCSHQCPRKCPEQCGNCYQPCLNKCSHKKCDRLCGEPCNLCQEPCDRGCVHSRCHRPCFAYCDRLPCSLPCPYLLPCLHPCLGFCGEVCPPVCLKCDPQYVRTITGNATSRLFVLEDCGHIVDATRMEAFMSRNKSCIVKCPIMSCQTPVVTTKRYHKEVTGAFYSIMNMKREMEAKRNGIFNTQNVSSFRSLKNIEKFTRDRDHSHASGPYTQTRVEQPPLRLPSWAWSALGAHGSPEE